MESVKTAADLARNILFVSLGVFGLVVGRGLVAYVLSRLPEGWDTRLGNALIEGSRYTMGERRMCALLGRTCPSCWDRKGSWIVRYQLQSRGPCYGKV